MRPTFRPTVARVDLDAIAHNARLLRRRAGEGTRVLAAVKADAYGHGAVAVARRLERDGVDWFGVATVEEGLELRSHGIGAPILLFSGPGRLGADAAVSQDLTCVVGDVQTAKRLNAAASRARRTVPVHLKLDTGMSRIGVMPDDWAAFVTLVGSLDNLHIDGVMTHLASADDGSPRTVAQLARFQRGLDVVAQQGHRPTFVHCDNSAGILGHDHGFGLVRPGISLYGPNPGGEVGDDDLRAALTWRTDVLNTKWIDAGTEVSYGGTWTAPRRTCLAVLPVGYADGYPRILSGRADVLVNGHRCPIRGRVCMDLMMVDVTEHSETTEQGTEVVLIGEQGGERIGASELAHLADTISYEILVGISGRVPRVWSGS